MAAFDRIAGVSGPAVQKVKVNGGVATPGDGQGEVNLDIDVIRAVAPKAQILDYEAPNKAGAIPAVIDAIVADGRADVVSISWGSCERNRSADAMARMARSMAAAASAGITVFVASGDHGAYDCVDQDREDLSVAVDSPSSDPNAIGVGGTYLMMYEDGTVIDEVAWEEPLTGWAPGGGLSVFNARPAWQRGLGVDNQFSNGMRQVPDVAAAADPSSGFLTVSDGESESSGGTSAAAPFWAAYTLLVRQLAAAAGGRPPRCARPDAVRGGRGPAHRDGLPRRDPRRQPARQCGPWLGLCDGARQPARHPAGAGDRRVSQGELTMDFTDTPYAADLDAEERGWYEIAEMVRTCLPDERLLPGYYRDPDWSLRDLVGHLGTWLAEAATQFERMLAGTYEGHDVDIDALNAVFLARDAGSAVGRRVVTGQCGPDTDAPIVGSPARDRRGSVVVDPQVRSGPLRRPSRPAVRMGGRARRPARHLTDQAAAAASIHDE